MTRASLSTVKIKGMIKKTKLFDKINSEAIVYYVAAMENFIYELIDSV